MLRSTFIRDAILECFRAYNGGPLTIQQCRIWIDDHYPDRWKDLSTPLADLTLDGNITSSYRETQKCLVRISRGTYRLASQFMEKDDFGALSDQTHNTPISTKSLAAGPFPENKKPGSLDFWLPGFPATFATAREAPWREAMEKAFPNAPDGVIPTGVLLSFSVEATTRGGQGFDLDNLCEPVFSVMVNRKGYFGGKRPNIRWWHASRRVASPGGCRIEFSNHNSPPKIEGDLVFAGKYQGELPRSASETAIAHWIETTGPRCQVRPEETIAVSLDFGTTSINIGDIATGRVKSVIDNLYPILGGVAGAPDDWRISELRVAKGQERLGQDELEICLYRFL